MYPNVSEFEYNGDKSQGRPFLWSEGTPEGAHKGPRALNSVMGSVSLLPSCRLGPFLTFIRFVIPRSLVK